MISLSSPGRAAPPDSPLTWREAREPVSISASVALKLGKRYLGRHDIDPTSQQLVSITDREDLGDPVRERLAHLMLFRSILFTRAYLNENAQIDLYLAVDATTGKLLFAFTPPKEEWAARTMGPRRSAGEEAEIIGWTLSPAPHDALKSTVIDVLQAVFESYGSGHIDTGQTVVRPRWIVQKFPARLVEGNIVSLRPPAPAWLVHAMGTVLGSKCPPPALDPVTKELIAGEPYFWTEELMLVADSTLVLCPCGAMP